MTAADDQDDDAGGGDDDQDDHYDAGDDYELYKYDEYDCDEFDDLRMIVCLRQVLSFFNCLVLADWPRDYPAPISPHSSTSRLSSSR